MNLSAVQTGLGIATSVLVVATALGGGMFGLIKLFLRLGGVLRAIDDNTEATQDCAEEIKQLRVDLREEIKQRRGEVREIFDRLVYLERARGHDGGR